MNLTFRHEFKWSNLSGTNHTHISTPSDSITASFVENIKAGQNGWASIYRIGLKSRHRWKRVCSSSWLETCQDSRKYVAANRSSNLGGSSSSNDENNAATNTPKLSSGSSNFSFLRIGWISFVHFWANSTVKLFYIKLNSRVIPW